MRDRVISLEKSLMLSSIDAELKVLDGMELRVKVMSGHLTNPNKIERHGI